VINWIIDCLVYLGSLLMVFNICGFVRFARRISGMKIWKNKKLLLHIPIVLLVLFLIGYLVVGVFGSPDMVMGLILFFGSVFVYVMYRLIDSITDRILKNEQVETQLRAAEEASRTRTAFLATMSHEMRTPMNVILGLSDLARKEPGLPEKTRQQLEKINQSGQHLLGLINHMLEINELGTGEVALKVEPLCPADILSQVNAITQPLCEGKGLQYRYEEIGPLPACCAGDAMQIKNLLLGLLNNAVKYTDAPGSVSFTVGCTQADGRAGLRFEVADTGIGMSEKFLPHVFDPFAQEDASSTNRFGGSGLSLAVSKKMADLMGGSLEARSEKGKGSAFTFTVSLPIVETEKEEDAPPAEDVALAGRRVLVVEDVPENAEIVQDLLELEDVASDHAENGQIALEMFNKAPPGTYDVILMDIRMPVMDGLEATRRIRALAREDAAAIPIIALTANAFQSDIDAALSAGMDALLAKPADAGQLYDTLKKWISVAQKQKGGLCRD